MVLLLIFSQVLPPGSGQMAQELSAPVDPTEDQGLFPRSHIRQLTTSYKSSCRVPDTLLAFMGTPDTYPQTHGHN